MTISNASNHSSIMSSPERPESYQPHHSSLHLSTSALSTSGTEHLSKEEGIVPVNSTSATTAVKTGTSKKRKRALMVCVAMPVAFYAIYGAVASTQDLSDSTNDQSAGMISSTSSTSQTERRDVFDGSITAATPSRHDLTTQRSTNPLFALLTGATFQPSDQDSIGLSSYLSNVASPHSQYNPRTQLPVMWTPGAPNYGFLVTKMHRCLDVVQASWLGRTAEEEGTTYSDDLRVVNGDEAQDRGRCIDVDMSTLHGVKRARDENLVDSSLADIIISPFLPEVLDLFTSSNAHRPRLMIILQDTKVRIKASYNYLHGRGLFHGSYLEFISSEHMLVNDYLVRMLSGQWDVSVKLKYDDLHVAVQELQSKFHVGVQRHIRTYMEQMVRLLGWQLPQADVVDCMFPSKFNEAHQPVYPQPKREETELETQMREIVRNKNRWDVQLLDIFVKRWDEGVFAS